MTGVYWTAEHPTGRHGAPKKYRDSEGGDWDVEVRLPGASNAMVVFHHPVSSRLNRYAWHIWRGPEARSVTARVQAGKVASTLTDADVALLFRRSMPVTATRATLAAG